MDLPHLLAAMTLLLGLLGGVTTSWRFDRMTTVLKAGTSDLTPMFAALSKHHAVSVVACRPRSGNRKGVVEKNNHTTAQRWWRNLADELTPEQAQHSLTTFATSQDGRHGGRDGSTTAAVMFAAERLAPMPPTVFPVVVTEERVTTRVVVHQRLGATTIDIATTTMKDLVVQAVRPSLHQYGILRELQHLAAARTGYCPYCQQRAPT